MVDPVKRQMWFQSVKHRHDVSCDGFFWGELPEGWWIRDVPLEWLNLNEFGLDHKSLAKFAEELCHIPHLKHLWLTKNDINNKGMVAFCAGLRHVPQLESLYLKGNDFGDEGVIALAHSLHHIPNLHRLGLNLGCYSQQAALEVIRNLKFVPKMEWLLIGFEQELKSELNEARKLYPQLKINE